MCGMQLTPLTTKPPTHTQVHYPWAQPSTTTQNHAKHGVGPRPWSAAAARLALVQETPKPDRAKIAVYALNNLFNGTAINAMSASPKLPTCTANPSRVRNQDSL